MLNFSIALSVSDNQMSRLVFMIAGIVNHFIDKSIFVILERPM